MVFILALPLFLLLAGFITLCVAVAQAPQLQACGDAFYSSSKYTCYDGDYLCPVLDGVPTLRCGSDCYLPSMYSCMNDHLVFPPFSTTSGASSSSSTTPAVCNETATQFHLSDPPYENYFYSDCHLSSQVVVTSPLESSNLTIIGPRLLIAWPAGNSGVVAFFSPQNGVNGSLAITVENSTTSQGTLSPIYQGNGTGVPLVGVSGSIRINSSAVLSVAILGSIRTIRDFTEGPSILVPSIQNATTISQTSNELSLTRIWLDNVTSTTLSFTPASSNSGAVSLGEGTNISFEAGVYNFSASYNYPQLDEISTKEVLSPSSQILVSQFPDQTTSLSFLSYSTKLLAGAWRFLTYFGRDSMISLLLLQPVLSEGKGGAIEAVIGAVLERINRTDGSVCHEETIGDYATYLNLQNNITSVDPQYDYKMVDSDYYLPIVMQNYFVQTETGRGRLDAFFSKQATVAPDNNGLSYADLALSNAEKIMNSSAPFAGVGGQTKDNLIHLKEGQVVGEWRDSTYGIGGGRIPFDVNTALVPAALRSISALASSGFFPEHPEWNSTASEYAKVWEDSTLEFFQSTIPQATAKSLVQNYVSSSGFPGPSNIDNITSDIQFHGLALDGNNNQSLVQVMNTDDCFRLFLVNSTNQTQLSSFLSQTADHILQPFPVGLSTPVGLVVANPAYGDDPVYAANFTNNAYHGTVVWSWQLAMMAAGLERQLDRCGSNSIPDFCSNSNLQAKVQRAYNHLWDLIEANNAQLSSEVWSWVYKDGDFEVTPLGALPPPPGSSPTESDVRQLWSLTFLAVTRNQALK